MLFFIEHKTFAEKATENRISDRFKLQKPFSDDSVNRVSRAIELFSKARFSAQKLKLNKATLLSWLLFYCRFEKATPPIDYLAFFEGTKTENRNDGPKQGITADSNLYPSYHPSSFERDLLNLFIDRSSLRVSDVSSVVYRDFAIWAIYISRGIGEVPKNLNINEVAHIADTIRARVDLGN
jgi:hypothetical protein